jgi:hypothetical protein
MKKAAEGPSAETSGRPCAAPHLWVDDPGLQPEPWFRLISNVVHPAKIAVIEAFLWIGEPLSKAELTRLFDDRDQFYISLVSYHVEGLDRCGILEVISTREIRGATETYYFFTRGEKW